MAAFPSFASCPLATPDVTTDISPYVLLGTIHENMTLSTTPTFVCKDRDSAPFALKINLPTGMAIEDFDYKKFKKGSTVVVKNAQKEGVVGGKQGFIETGLRDTEIVPAKLEKVLAMASDPSIELSNIPGSIQSKCLICQACRTEGTEETLLRCTGCGTVRYCNKYCQKEGWSEKGHKGDCKILKILGGMELGSK